MAFLSGKVAIVIITCVSVIIISSIVIPIAVVFSGGESKITLTTTKITTTTEEGKSNSSKLTLFEFLLKKILTTNSLPITLIQFPNYGTGPTVSIEVIPTTIPISTTATTSTNGGGELI